MNKVYRAYSPDDMRTSPNTILGAADKEPVVIMQHTTPRAVLVSVEHWNNVVRQLEDLRPPVTRTICYARSSNYDDLARQKQYLSEQFKNAEIISDIGSVLNSKREGLRTILDKLMHGDNLTIVVAHKDRLARFEFNLIEYMVEQNGGSIIDLDQNTHSPQQEIAEDVSTILTVFGARIKKLRKYREEIEKDASFLFR